MTEDLKDEKDRFEQMKSSLNMNDEDKLEFARSIRHTEGQLKHMNKMYSQESQAKTAEFREKVRLQ